LNIAHPATLIIGGNKTLLYIYRGDNQHDRAPVDEVIAALQSLK
jgi:peroxiredoxin